MILSETAISRPVLTTMVMGAIVVFGLISFRDIGIDLFPRVEFPIITIVSVLPGADPETVETTVSDPIEEAVATVSGIKTLRSVSSDSVSQVIIEFELEKNVDVAYQEVQAKIGSVRSLLPEDLDDPVMEKFDVDAAPILAVLVSGPLPPRDLTHLADKTVRERLQRLRNVGQVRLVGGQDRQIWVLLDRPRLEGHGLSALDVQDALRREHVELPGGRLETGPMEYVVKTKAEFTSAEELEGMVVAWRNNAPVRIRDIGRVVDGLQERRSAAALNGVPAIACVVRRQSGTNTVAVARAVKAEVENLRAELAPQGVKLEIAQDLSLYIERSVEEVQFHLRFGGTLAVLIVLVFLRNLRSTFISSLVLPTSVLGAFILMNALGFTQNMMTLLALSLAIGLLIDDAIVVQESIMRHVERGLPRREAASRATKEIAPAVIATSLSVISVFVPVAFMKGIVGRFFYQFGLTVAFAVAISTFVSLSLDPMLSSRILRPPRHGWLMRVSEAGFQAIDRVYERILAFALRHRWLVVLLAIASFVGAGWVGRSLRSEFIPAEDQSEFNVKVKAPLGASLETTEAIMERIRDRIRSQPWLDYAFVTIGSDQLQRVNEGTMYVKMRPKDQRPLRQLDAMVWLRQEVAGIKDAKVSVEIVPRVSGGGMKYADIQLEVRGPDLDRLEAIGSQVMAAMRQAGGYADIDTSYEKDKPEIGVYVKRDRAADLGISPRVVAATVKSLIGGEDVAKFRAEGDRYDISVRLPADLRRAPEDILSLTLRNPRGDLVRLANVAEIRQRKGPVQIDRFNRARQLTVLTNLDRSKKVLGPAVDELTTLMKSLKLPSGYSFGFVGMADTMKESFGYLFFALQLAIVMIYMVLASQFESFLHPLTIMLSVPLSIIGALGALVLADQTVSIFTMIGIIMLMGLVTKNGILLVDYTNVLRRRDGLERNAAILRAGPVRLRPILMTSFAIIFGMSPVALGTGAGSESRAPMAVAVIGGMITSTLLTLVVVPVAYTLIDDLAHPRSWRVWRLFRRRASPPAAG